MQQFTNKALKESRSLTAPYCAIQNVEGLMPRIGYTCGIYGWNADVYACGNVLVVTGYRPAGRFALTVQEMETLNQARNIDPKSETPYTDMREKLARILDQIYINHCNQENESTKLQARK